MIKCKPSFLAATLSAMVLATSHSAIAETNTNNTDSQDRLKDLIDESLETQRNTNVPSDASNNVQRRRPSLPVIYNTQETIIESQEATEEGTPASDEEVADVNAQVQEEINEQREDDEVDAGQVVEAPSISDDDSIKSIENKNGKIYKTTNLSNYARQVNTATWSPNMRKNTAMTVKLQTLLDWNHASPGPIDGGWGMNSKKALANFQQMRGLPSTGRMDSATWRELTKNVNMQSPVLVQYTITKDDVDTNFASTPSGAEAKSKMKGLYYQNIKEMFGERFHMDVRYLEKLNKGKKFVAGETITVINVGDPLDTQIDHVVADKASETLYAYNGKKLVATYPTTVGSSNTPSPSGSFKIVNKVKMPWYKATVKNSADKKVFMLPPGPNNPVGVVWMGLSKPSYGIHGSPIPEGISRQASAGCVRLTNWDVLEVYANIVKGATVELK